MSASFGARYASVRRLRSSQVFLLVAAALALALVAGFLMAKPAFAADYPSWADVQAAKANAAAKAAQVTKIQGLISSLSAELAAASAEAEARGAEYGEAQQKFDEADQLATTLNEQAQAAAKKAADASTQAGRLAAQLYRSGGSDLSLSLMLESDAGDADALLSKLGNMSKMVERSSAIYAEARTAQNEAEALKQQAEIAKTAREALRVEAEAKFQAAAAAQKAAQGKLAAGQAQQETLNAQLAALNDNAAATVAGYENGLAEQRRLAAIAAAADAASRGVSISQAGWTQPIPGAEITDVFGPRPNFYIPGVGWTGSFHDGTDLGGRCGTPIYAVSGGTVTYAGSASGYGQLVVINHGGGISSAYGHVQSNGYAVSVGQDVNPGQLIAHVGMTGLATGCHLHFEIRRNGGKLDAVPWMANHGAPLE
jgi:murein DD-endopeptidase MepM/ murein hydrolase activator NlpD